jgi:hypothetical protein
MLEIVFAKLVEEATLAPGAVAETGAAAAPVEFVYQAIGRLRWLGWFVFVCSCTSNCEEQSKREREQRSSYKARIQPQVNYGITIHPIARAMAVRLTTPARP